MGWLQSWIATALSVSPPVPRLATASDPPAQQPREEERQERQHRRDQSIDRFRQRFRRLESKTEEITETLAPSTGVFHQGHELGADPPEPVARICVGCGSHIEASRRADTRTCSNRCRKRVWRRRDALRREQRCEERSRKREQWRREAAEAQAPAPL